MPNKGKEKTIVVGIVVLVVIAIVVAWAVFRPRPKPVENGNPSGIAGTSSTAPQSTTMAPVPANVTVPNQGDLSAPQGVALPEVQTNAHPAGGPASYRQFTIKAENDVFTPSIAIVNVGDIVDFEISATDKDYDFTQPDYGFNAVSIKKGTTKKIQFQTLNPGKFTFYCSACGGPSAGPVGYLIVTGG